MSVAGVVVPAGVVVVEVGRIELRTAHEEDEREAQRDDPEMSHGALQVPFSAPGRSRPDVQTIPADQQGLNPVLYAVLYRFEGLFGGPAEEGVATDTDAEKSLWPASPTAATR